MSKIGITDFDIGIGWRSPSYYDTTSKWMLDLYGEEQFRSGARNRKRGLPWNLSAGVIILGFYIQIDLKYVSKG